MPEGFWEKILSAVYPYVSHPGWVRCPKFGFRKYGHSSLPAQSLLSPTPTMEPYLGPLGLRMKTWRIGWCSDYSWKELALFYSSAIYKSAEEKQLKAAGGILQEDALE